MNHNTKNSINTQYKDHKTNHCRQYYFLCLLIICLLSFAATSVNAATYYLDASASGSNNGSSWTDAWITISDAFTFLDALPDNGSGDTLLVRNGNYGGLGTASARTDWLTIQADTGHTSVIFDYAYLNAGGNPNRNLYLHLQDVNFKWNELHASNNCGVRLFRSGYVKMTNVTFTGKTYTPSSLDYYNWLTQTSGYGIELNYGCSNITVDNCAFVGWKNAIYSRDAEGTADDATKRIEYVAITDCEISECKVGGRLWGHNFTVTGNHLHNLYADGLLILATDTVIENNHIDGIDRYAYIVDETGASYSHSTLTITANSGTPYTDIQSYSYARITVDDVVSTSLAISSFTDNTITLTGSYGADEATITKVEIEPAWHCDAIQLMWDSGDDNVVSDNVIIRGNRIHNQRHQGIYSNTVFASGGSIKDLTIENNIVYDVVSGAIQTASTTGLIIRNNTVDGITVLREGSVATEIANNLFSYFGRYDTWPSPNNESVTINYLGYNIINQYAYSGDAGGTNLDYDDSALFQALFADYDNNDFTLANGSTAINFGDADSDPDTDIVGVTRDADHHSAGAYEFTGPALASIGDKDVDESEELAFSISAHDINGDPITYSAAGAAITAGGVLTGPNFTWTPNGSQAGTYQATFTATAGEQTDFETITITVNNVINTAPVLASIGSKSGSEGLLIGFTTSASDSDFPANDLTFSLEGTPPTGASIDAVTGYFTWVPTEAQGPGTYNVTVRVTDDGTGNLYDEEVVAITVSEVNASPTLSTIGSKSANEGALLTFTASANDNDVPANTLSFSLINAPAGASIGSGTGVFAWTPSESHGSNSYSVTVRVTDNGSPNLYDEETINISVTETNTDPVLDPIGDKATNVGSQLTFTANATDADVPANTLTYSLTTAPAGASIGSETGVFTWTPSSGYEQTFNVTVRVTDDGAGTLFDEETITITVGPDVTDPTVTNLSPADADVQVSIDSLIILTIADAGIGVDLNTVTIDVDGDRIYDGGSETSEGVYESTGNVQTVKGICRRTGTSAAYSFFFQADARFDYEKNITVTVNASDLASTSNDMAEQSYSFYTVMREFEGNAKVNSDTGTLVQDRPAVAKDSDGNIWAVWDQTTIAGDTDVYIGKLAVDDSAFGESTQVTSDTNNQRNAVIAIDSNNKIYLAWQDYRQGEWDVYLATSTDGVTFSTETRITDPNSNQINPDIAIDSSDKVYIVWEDDQNSNNDIYIASSTNSFVSKTTSQITSNASGQGSPAIAIDSAKTVYVVWTDARNASNDIYGATSTSGPWTNAAIVNNANGQSSPVIATETSGTVLHLLWVDDTSGDNDIFYGATTGGLAGLPLTGTDISDDTTSSDQSNPSIFATGTTGSNLRVFACWKDSRDVVNNNADTDIYYGETALGGSTFGTNVLVNDDSGTNTQSVPVVNVDINGNPYLAWVDNRGGNKDIYYAGAMLMGSVLVTSPLITVGTGGTVEVDDTTSNIDSATDVRVVIPAGTLPADTTITISEMINPPSPPSGGFGVNYEFGPSGLVFNSPVTIYLPHAAADCPGHAVYRAYWYNLELSAWYPPGGIAAQHGVDPVSGVHYITFETDHFTGFGVGGGSAGGGGGGGGGCSMSPDGQGTIVEFLVPYIGLAIVMAIMKLKGRRKKNLHRYTGSD